MFTNLLETQRAALTVVVFIGTFFVALTIGRLLKRRAGVRFGVLYQLFCLVLAFYAALSVYGVQADWKNHIGAGAVLLSTAVVALVNRYVWDFYFEKRRQTPIPHFLREVFALVIFLIALLLVLSIGYHASAQLKGVVAGSGVAAIILGLAGQNLLSGIIAGVSLQISRPYKVGDWLKVGETFAEVMEINWRSTRLRTNDTIYLDIPNSEIIKTTIVNLHYPTELHAMRIRVGVDYNVPPNRVKDALARAAQSAKNVLPDPPVRSFPGRFRRSRRDLRDQVLHGQSFPDQRDQRLRPHECLVRAQTSADHHPLPDSHLADRPPRPALHGRRSRRSAQASCAANLFSNVFPTTSSRTWSKTRISITSAAANG